MLCPPIFFNIYYIMRYGPGAHLSLALNTSNCWWESAVPKTVAETEGHTHTRATKGGGPATAVTVLDEVYLILSEKQNAEQQIIKHIFIP